MSPPARPTLQNGSDPIKEFKLKRLEKHIQVAVLNPDIKSCVFWVLHGTIQRSPKSSEFIYFCFFWPL